MHLPRLASLQHFNPTTARPLRSFLGGGALTLSLALAGGCDTRSWLDPSEMAGARSRAHEPLKVRILETIDPALEETEEEFLNATEVTATDLQAPTGDYAISRNDLLTVSVSDLQGVGVETVRQPRVSESGNISLPYIGQVRAEGQTEIELENTIIEAYGPRGANLIARAQVTVQVIEARGRAFSVLGQVNRPGQFAIIESDFRVLDALVLAADTQSPLNETLYVIRRLDERSTPRPGEGPGTTQPAGPPPTGPGADDLTPRSDDLEPRSDAGSNVRNGPAPIIHLNAALQDELAPAGAAEPTAPADDERPTINLDGRELPAQEPESTDFPPPADAPGGVGGGAGTAADTPGAADAPGTMQPAAGEPSTAPGGFEFNDLAPAPEVRIIRIPLDELRKGELRYNIAIRPRDTLFVPSLTVGEYYMGGHVGRPGAYSLTGRDITLKQAIISAGMLDPLAIPQRTDLIRRIGEREEVFVRVDLDKIFAGTQPDLYLKPNDQVLVGTNALAPFIAALRNAFRFTYGAGFLYDRNFAYDIDRFNGNNRNNGGNLPVGIVGSPAAPPSR